MGHDRESAAREFRQAVVSNFGRRIAKRKRKKVGLPRLISKGEYRDVYLPKHPRAKCNGRVYEHILVAEYHIGRFRWICHNHPDNQVVHHKDMDKSNNHPSNLQIMGEREHRQMHGYMMGKNWPGNG